MTEIPTLLVVAAALVDDDGHILLQQRAQGRQMEGLWEFPGGKVDPGEVPEAALIRELQEELGIEVALDQLTPACFASAALGTKHLLLLLYFVRRWSGTPLPLDATALKWLPPSDMVPDEMPPADRPLIALLESLLRAQGAAAT